MPEPQCSASNSTVREKICEVSNEAMAFANRGTYGNNFTILTWTQKENDTKCRAWARLLSQKFKIELERGKREGDITPQMEGVGQYVNSDGESTSPYLFSILILPTNALLMVFATGLNADDKSIFGGSYERLVELKGKFDPGSVFCKAHLGASLVGK